MKSFRFIRLLVLLCPSLLVGGCTVGPPVVQPWMPTQLFDPAPFAKYETKGSSAIIGSAFLKTRGGDVKLGAGNIVKLTPSTPYTDERYRLILSTGNPGPPHVDLAKHQRTTIADAQGHFEFHDLPAGSYYLSCLITWQAGYVQTGGQALAAVTLGESETKNVVLTR